MLLADGLDEVATREQRLNQLMLLLQATGDVPRPALVLSGRLLVLDELRSEERRRLTILHCRQPEPRDIHTFLQAFFRSRGRADEATRAYTELEHRPELMALASSPLLLVFLALLYDIEGQFPDRRSVLYHRVTEVLVDRWERTRRRARGMKATPIPLGDTWRVLRVLAWWSRDRRNRLATTDELRQQLITTERSRGESETDAAARAERLLLVLQQESAILVSQPGDMWSFAHATLAEYLAGSELARDPERWRSYLADPFLADRLEVLAFAAGSLGRQADDAHLEELGQALLRGTRVVGRKGAIHVALLSAVLREDPGFRRSTQRLLVARFCELCLNAVFWPRSRPAAAEALAEVVRLRRERTYEDDLRAWIAVWLARPNVRPENIEIVARLAPLVADVSAETWVEALKSAPQPEARRLGWQLWVDMVPGDSAEHRARIQEAVMRTAIPDWAFRWRLGWELVPAVPA